MTKDSLHVVTEPWEEPLGVRSPEEVEAEAAHERRVLAEVAGLRAKDEARARLRQEREGASVPAMPDEHLGAMLAAPRAKERYVIEGLHNDGHNSAIEARFKVGKTVVAGNIVHCRMSGSDLFGRFAVRPIDGSVLYLDFEQTVDDGLDRWERMRPANTHRIRYFNLRGARLNLANDAHAEALVAYCIRHEVEDIVGDTYRRMFRGFSDNPNDNGAAEAFTERIDLIKGEAGVRNLFLTVHMGHGAGSGERQNEHARGASAIDDWVDNRWIYSAVEQRRFLYVDGRASRTYLGGGVAEFELVLNLDTDILTAADANRKDARAESEKQETERLAGRIGQWCRENPGKAHKVGEVHTALGITDKDKRWTPALRSAAALGAVCTNDQDGSPCGPHKPWPTPEGVQPYVRGSAKYVWAGPGKLSVVKPAKAGK